MNTLSRWLGNKISKWLKEAETETMYATFAEGSLSELVSLEVEKGPLTTDIIEDSGKIAVETKASRAYRVEIDGQYYADVNMEDGDISPQDFDKFMRHTRPFAKKLIGKQIGWYVKNDKEHTVFLSLVSIVSNIKKSAKRKSKKKK